VTKFLALVTGGQRLSSVGGVCHDLEMMVLHDMLSPAPDVATGACVFLSLAVSEARRCLRLERCLVSQRSRASTVSEARRWPCLSLRAEGSMTTHVVIFPLRVT
jgi:hypothetical protein